MNAAVLAWMLLGQAGASASASDVDEPPPRFQLSGYVETYYQWNFNVPDNGITSFRAFDNRHNSLTLENAALIAAWDAKNVVGSVGLQVGAAPATYYLGEPALAGADGASATGAELFRLVQEANVGYRFALLDGLLVRAGVFLSPIGPETVAIKDVWFWSRSDLFFGLPFYHAGIHASLSVDEHGSVHAMLTNGWNDIVDNNDGKSVAFWARYADDDRLVAQLLYFGGPERPTGAPEDSSSWRNLFDAYLTWGVTDGLTLQIQGDAGLEPNALGVAWWVAGAVAARVQLARELFVAGRVDGFWEEAPPDASRIFWPVRAVASATGTVELRPAEQLSLRLELRHDQADGEMYFGGDVTGDGAGAPFVPNRGAQDTLTAGLVAWF